MKGVMNIIKRNRILLYVCLSILMLCLGYHLVAYFIVRPFVFQELTSARILGSNESSFFIELQYRAKNPYLVPYKVSPTEAFFYDNEALSGEVEFIDEVIKIRSFTNNLIRLNITLPRETFQRLMSNRIDEYAFQMVAYLRVQNPFFIFFIKEMRLNQFLPVNINRLMLDYLSAEFGNRISMNKESIRFQDLQNQTIMTCEVSIMNRGNLELFFRSFEGTVHLNYQINGTASSFTPVQFTRQDRAKTAQMVFRLDNILQKKDDVGYTISGNMIVSLWGRNYRFPIELIGEV